MRVVVVGAGATGLSAAYLLARAGADVTVLEASSQPGGLLATIDIGSERRLECFYHHFFTHDAEIHWLLEQLGLSRHLRFHGTKMGVFREGRIFPFDGAKDLLKFTPIPFGSRIRFGLSSLLLAYRKGYSDCEEVAALPWFEKNCGLHATNAIWRPLLESKFGEAAPQVPLAWMAGRLRQRLRSRRVSSEQLGYLDGSLQRLVDGLVAALEDLGVKIHLGTPAERLAIDGQRKVVTGVEAGGQLHLADRVLATVPTPVLARLVEPHDADYASALNRIEYLGAICTVLSLKEPLSDVYWTNVTDRGYDFGGVIEHTNFIPASEYAGQHLVYLSRYLFANNPLWSMAEDEFLHRQLDQLKRMYGRDLRPLVNRHWIFRGRCAAPVPDTGFHGRIPQMQSSIANLLVANMAHVYPDERSVNNSIRVAAEAVRTMGFADVAAEVPEGFSLAGKYGTASCPDFTRRPTTLDRLAR